MLTNLDTGGVLGDFLDADDAAMVQLVEYTLVHGPHRTLLRIPRPVDCVASIGGHIVTSRVKTTVKTNDETGA
jgi:hypothetical protein